MPTAAFTVTSEWTKVADGAVSVVIPAIQRFYFCTTSGAAPDLPPSVCPSRERGDELSASLLAGQSLYVAADQQFSTSLTTGAITGPFDAGGVESAAAAEDAANRAEAARDDASAVAGIREFRDVATLLANATLTYGPGAAQVQAGDIIRTRAEGFSYRVAASGATDHHVTTANGGVKLYVLRAVTGDVSRAMFGGDTKKAADFAIANSARMDLEGQTVSMSAWNDAYYGIFRNGFINVANIKYPVNIWTFKKKTIVSDELTASLGGTGFKDMQYSAWPQGKVWKQLYNGARKMLFNRGADHSGAALHVWSMTIGSAGEIFDPLIRAPRKSGLSGGVSCWSAGTDGVREYFITKERGANYNIGTTRHFLHYATLTSGYIDDGERKEILLNNGTEVPIMFHSFARLGNGRFASGAHYNSGQCGIAITADLGNSWTFSEMKPVGSDYVEPSVYYDEENAVTVGFLRTQNTASRPQFWVSGDNCETFTFTDLLDIPSADYVMSPINIHKAGNYYYAFVTGRVTSTRMYLLIAECSDALANGASAFEKYYVGNSRYVGTGGSGAGAGDIFVDGETIYLYYGEHQSVGRPDFVELKSLEIVRKIVAPDRAAQFARTGDNIRLPYEETAKLAPTYVAGKPTLGPGWAADDSDDGVNANGGGVRYFKSGRKVRVIGALKSSGTSNLVGTLPAALIPWLDHRVTVEYNDGTVDVLRIYGAQSTSGTPGQMRLVKATGALTKVRFDFEMDLLRVT